MSSSYIKSPFLLLIILFINILNLKNVVASSFHVQVVNNIDPTRFPFNSIKLHCASKDNDMGFHDITPNNQFEWTFKEGYFSNTLFFCHFWWGLKERAFEVFNVFHGCIKNAPLNPDTRLCKWTITDIGFFLEDDKGKKYIAYAWEPLKK
uniref:S-protein homolog n=1 Tax=Solanum tuberosum TaxID=4113 RepID=M1AGG2_SOLTU